MFKRLRHLRISLAAKCQILFGAAVVLIIGAALFVPWQRMEQLTEQLNERAAGALAERAIVEHVEEHAGHAERGNPRPVPTAGPTTAAAAASPATQPRSRPRPAETASAGTSPAARLVPLGGTRDGTEISRFDQRALSHFARNRESMVYSAYYDRGDQTKGYRYSQPLYLVEACQRCHEPVNRRGELRANVTVPITQPAALVAAGASGAAAAAPAQRVPLIVDGEPKRAGIVSVDIGSRIDAYELLLNRVFILLAGLLAGGMAIITFYFITTRLILQPVRVLQETAEKVSKGDLNIRSDISTGDEFQQLSETFNVMLANLKRNADQLRSVNKSLDLKLGQLAESNVALYESNRLKSEFLANVSHELRTPLNSILGFAELLKDAVGPVAAAGDGKSNGHGPAGGVERADGRDAARDAKSARYIQNIVQSGRNLLDLINDLLDLAKIEAGRMEIRSEPLSLGDLFEGLTTILKPLAEKKNVQVVAGVAPDVPIVQSDPGKLQQVLYNFLSNAIKFSPDGAPIDLSATMEDPGRVRIAVADRGPGIDPEKHSVIFEKFRQVDSSHTRSHSGTGLGLAISKELTTLMGGSIGVNSVPGEGATFWVVLPVKVQAGHADVRGRMVMA